MIILDDFSDPTASSKARFASSQDAEAYIDEHVPYTDQLEEAMNANPLLASQSSSSPGPSTEIPAPLPPSYEATVHTPRHTYKNWYKGRRRRWVLPLALAVLYLLVAGAILIPWIVSKKRQPAKKFPPPHFPKVFLPEPVDPSSVLPPLATAMPPILAMPATVDSPSIECETWSREASEATETLETVSYKFPLKDFIYVTNRPKHERGSNRGPLGHSAGALRVSVNEDPREDQVVIEVAPRIFPASCKQTAKFCIERSEAGATLRIEKTNQEAGMWKPIFFDANLRFPARRELFVRNFSTNLNLFEHTFEDLRGKVQFDTVSVRGQFTPFVAKGLDVGELSVTTNVKAITGLNVNASRAVTFQTTLAPVHASVILSQREVDSPALTFNIATTESPIKASLVLDKSKEWEGRPRYSAMVTTKNGNIDMSVAHSGSVEESTLDMMVETTAKPVRVRLDPHYEGGFEVKTKAAAARVLSNRGGTSPDGQRRQIAFERRTAWSTSGWVGRMERPTDPAGRGHVEVSTELAEAVLDLS